MWLVGSKPIRSTSFCAFFVIANSSSSERTNINHKGLQRTANEYAEERRIYKDLISKNNNVDMLNSASRILQCWSYYVVSSESIFCTNDVMCVSYDIIHHPFPINILNIWRHGWLTAMHLACVGSVSVLPACRRLLFPLLQQKEIGDVCTQASFRAV